MTQNIRCETWEDLTLKVSELDRLQKTNNRLLPTLRFRGQANAEWQLVTTLDRNNGKEMKFIDYYLRILSLKPEIEAFTGNEWALPDFSETISAASKYDFFFSNKSMHTSIYGYMAHLRHHKFPSPLLDWTQSLYVAAYFALASGSDEGDAAIYVLSESKMTSGSSRKPEIMTLGPTVKTHKRHFLQQSEYTLCAKFTDNNWHFAEHESSFEHTHDVEHPVNSTIYKLLLPRKERLRILKNLDQFNLNAFSLIGSEESLMETLSLRQFYFSADQ